MTDFRTRKIREARRAVGLPQFERLCRREYDPDKGRYRPAYKVAGTTEHRQYELMQEQLRSYLARYNITPLSEKEEK